MRIVVTGKSGQVSSALVERSRLAGVTVVQVGRPEFDLATPANATEIFAAAEPDVIVSAAAYTAVDKAESESDLALAINAGGPGAVGKAAMALGIPVIHLSTDYVFDGQKKAAWVETDLAAPLGVYGASKLAGEESLLGSGARAVILRLAWVYGPHGANFVRTMLRLAENRERLGVVDDQFGAPTSALDIADGIFAVARRLIAQASDQSVEGIFHMGASGPDCSWADFAEAIFEGAAARGRPRPVVDRITTAEYPTPAKRPARSRLDSAKLAAVHGVILPDWRGALENVLDRLIAKRLIATERSL